MSHHTTKAFLASNTAQGGANLANWARRSLASSSFSSRRPISGVLPAIANEGESSEVVGHEKDDWTVIDYSTGATSHFPPTAHGNSSSGTSSHALPIFKHWSSNRPYSTSKRFSNKMKGQIDCGVEQCRGQREEFTKNHGQLIPIMTTEHYCDLKDQYWDGSNCEWTERFPQCEGL